MQQVDNLVISDSAAQQAQVLHARMATHNSKALIEAATWGARAAA